MEEVKNIPKLRFPEFDEKWSVKRIHDVFSIFNGYAFSSGDSFNSGVRWVKISDVGIQKINEDNPSFLPEHYLHLHKRFLLQEGDYVIALTRPFLKGELKIGKINKKYNNSLLNQRVGKIVSDNNHSFIYNLLQRKVIIRSIENNIAGSDPPNLSPNEINNIIVLIPTLPEQQKIASFLTSINDKIQQLTRKKSLLEQYKKGVMQKIFSQEIRFKDDEENEFPQWKEVKLGEVFSRVTNKNTENNKTVLTISAQQGLVDQEKFFNKSVSANDVTGYYLLAKGDFAYNKSYSNGYPLGAIKRLVKFDKGVVSTLYICFRIKHNYIPEFYDQFFNSGFMNKELHKIAQEGARNHGLLNMSVVEFFSSIKIPLPTISEQLKIASFLSSIDQKIELVNTQLLKTQAFKKGLLQQMFV